MSIVSILSKVGAVVTISAGGYWVYKKLKAASVDLSIDDKLREVNEELNKSWKILVSCAKAATHDSTRVEWLADYEALRERMTGPRSDYAVVTKLLHDINVLLDKIVGDTH